tara:strand:+ start:609 stop:1541 length:933 start_codon:yes stop_codon:yes gene_type:complete
MNMKNFIYVILISNFLFGQKSESFKYFKTNLKRSEILKDEISQEESIIENHFKAFYNEQGNLIKIEYYPNKDKIIAEEKKRSVFPESKPPFKYFRKWDPHYQKLGQEISENKLGSKSFYKVSFGENEKIKVVENFRLPNKKLWSFYRLKLEKDKKERLYIISSKNQPITKISPHLFHISASEMKNGWIARFRHNRLNLPVETIISDPEGNIYYFYRFKHQYKTQSVNSSSSPVSFRYTTSNYFLADSTKMGSHTLTFTSKNRLLNKKFYDKNGNPLNSIEYLYNMEEKEMISITRDSKNGIIERTIKTLK